MNPLLAETHLAHRHSYTHTGGPRVDPNITHTNQVKSLIRAFLEDVGFDRNIHVIKDAKVKDTVWQYFKDLNLVDTIENAVHQTLIPSVDFACQGYTSLPADIKVLCAIQFLYMFLVDDVAEELIEDLQAFGPNFILNKPHRHVLLTALDEHTRNLSHYYGSYCYSAIVKSLLDYVNGRIIEHKMALANFKFTPEHRGMPMFLRTKVGGAEIMAHLLFPKSVFSEEEYFMQYFPVMQHLVLFIDFTNDILSYYKEFCLGDENRNFVANFAEAHHLEHLDVLQSLASYTPSVTKSAYQVLRNNPSMVALVKDFVQGNVMLFTTHRRYHLVELFEDEKYLLPYEEDE